MKIDQPKAFRCNTAAPAHPRARTEEQTMLRIASTSTAHKPTAQPDAELISLGREFDKATVEADALDDNLQAISDCAFTAVEPPVALAFRDADRSLLDVYALPPADGFYSIDAVSQFRSGRYGLSDGDCVRKCEILSAWDKWLAAVEAIENANGAAIREKHSQALARARDIGKKIMLTSARSVAGSIVKARVARWCNAEDIEYLNGELNDHNMVDSLIDDLLAMAADRPPSPLAPSACANQNAATLRDSAVA